MVFERSNWIWPKSEYQEDDYAEFVADFNVDKKENILIRIACDSIYAMYLNHKLISFSQCSDFPTYKFYNEVDISNLVCNGKNKLKIQVYHMGVDTQTYIKDAAGLIFEVVQDGKVLLGSDADTKSRVMNEYSNGYKKFISVQLGYSFCFDNTKIPSEFSTSLVSNKMRRFYKRNAKGLVLQGRSESKLVSNNGSLIFDVGKEIAGFIELDIDSTEDQLVTISYGEHLKDKEVRRCVGKLDFSVEIVLKKGKNVYLNPFRRLAGRYLQVYFSKPITVNYIGLREVNYPVTIRPAKLEDPTLQKIYDLSVRTLQLCMHEHYEDCPWREQALYTMDSRNQMLCGYYAFNEFEYPRYNLHQIGQSLNSCNLLTICSPSGRDIPIPVFSLIYIIEVYEYVVRTNDRSLLDEVGDTIHKIVNNFVSKIDETGLICSFPYPCWNYYEWTEGSDNEYQLKAKSNDDYIASHDLLLNAFFVYSIDLYNKLFNKNIDVLSVKNNIEKTFHKNGVYILSDKNNNTSQLANAMALLIGLGDDSLRARLLTDTSFIPATLSMQTFVYEALLTDSKYQDAIIDDIKNKYKVMLDANATSLWETLKGEDDFGGCGSLCHGWSAMPIYYFHRFNLVK